MASYDYKEEQRKYLERLEAYIAEYEDKNKFLLIWFEIYHRDINKIKQRIKDDPSLIYAVSLDTGRSLLKIALRYSRKHIITYLLSKMEYDVVSPKSSMTSLMYAITHTNSYLIPLKLVQKFNNINQKDSDGDTALHLAICKSYALFEHRMNLAEMLLENGADPMIKNLEDKTPLDYARLYINNSLAILLERYVKSNDQ